MAEHITRFTPEQRQQTLDRLVEEMRLDDRIVGLAVLGSGARGFTDAYSDIELTVAVAEEALVYPVYTQWQATISQLFTLLHSYEKLYGPQHFYSAFLLEGYLEVAIDVVSLSQLCAQRDEWEILYDRSEQMADILRVSWEQRVKPNVKLQYQTYLNAVWHLVIQATIAVKRDKLWRAYHTIGRVREQAIEIAGWRHQLETTKDFRKVDRLPAQDLAKFEKTVVSYLEGPDLLRALRATVAAFFHEAIQLDNLLGLDGAADLGQKMQTYLDLMQ